MHKLSVLASCSLLAIGCSQVSEVREEPGSSIHASREAKEELQEIKTRFVIRPDQLPPAEAFDAFPAPHSAVEPAALGVHVESGKLVSDNDSSRRHPKVTQSLSYDGGFSLRDDSSETAIHVRLAGARPALAEASDGLVIYRHATEADSTVIHRLSDEGMEDFLHLKAKEDIVYEVALDHVAGLRMLAESSIVEFLDETGAPRLRMTAPLVLDASGAKVVPETHIEGCAFDSDPRPPWGRAVTAPGSATCRIRLSWRDAIQYPVLVDPGWVAGGVMGTKRNSYSGTQITVPAAGSSCPNPASLATYVMVAGGIDAGTSSITNTTEFYDVGSNTWSSGPSMGATQGRYLHSGVRGDDGLYPCETASVCDDWYLVAGGYNAGALATAVLFSVSTGTWSSVASMTGARYSAAAGPVDDDDAMFTGGYNGTSVLGSTQKYKVSSNTWSSGGNLTTGRYTHTISHWNTSGVRCSNPVSHLVAIGGDGGSGPLSSIELWSTATGSWTTGTALPTAAVSNHAAVQSGGNVYVIGGLTGSGPTTAVQVYATSTDTWTTPSGLALSTGRFSHAAAVGKTSTGDTVILAGGGITLTSYLNSSELLDITAGTRTVDTTTLQDSKAYFGIYSSGTAATSALIAPSGGTNSASTLHSDKYVLP